MNWSIYLFCVTAKHPVSWVDPSLWLVRTQRSWVNWAHPTRVMCKTATVRSVNVAEERVTCGGPAQGWCVGPAQGSSTLRCQALRWGRC